MVNLGETESALKAEQNQNAANLLKNECKKNRYFALQDIRESAEDLQTSLNTLRLHIGDKEKENLLSQHIAVFAKTIDKFPRDCPENISHRDKKRGRQTIEEMKSLLKHAKELKKLLKKGGKYREGKFSSGKFVFDNANSIGTTNVKKITKNHQFEEFYGF